ncbi:MAG: hypothetical protein IPG96_16690 [Proteobacteria bacterium]|nr:hypothetical protein [Pseudomonadota bacterium]
MSGLVVRGVASSAPDSVRVRTFLEDGTARFVSKGKRTRATELVIHETVTRSVDSTIAVLKKRGLSVHLVLQAGRRTDPARRPRVRMLWHAGPVHNGRVVAGVGVVNPYYRGCSARASVGRSIKGAVVTRGAVCLPTPAQAEAVAALTGALG